MKHENRRFTLLFELIEDKVNVRMLTALSAAIIYFFTIYLIFNTEGNDVALVDVNVPPPAKLTLANSFKTVRTAIITVYNSYGKVVPNIGLSAKVIDFYGSSAPDRVRCDKRARGEIAGTLEYIRLQEVCRIILDGNYVTANKDGGALFDSTVVSRGPEGAYKFTFNSSDVISESYWIFYSSNVFNAQILNWDEINRMLPIHPMQKWGVQPKLKLTLADGSPAIGKRVIAFSWPEPSFYVEKGSTVFMDSIKFASLENAVSEPSDSNGIAVFNDLYVTGYTYSMGTYLLFSVDGAIITSAKDPMNNKPKIIEDLPVFTIPLLLNTTVNKLKIITGLPDKIEEGTQFPIPPVIQVLDAEGRPIPGKLVYALKSGYNKVPYNRHYEPDFSDEYKKELLKPIPGVYCNEFLDPLKACKFTPIYTNDSGMVEFKDLQFSVYGAASDSNEGTYLIEFVSDGVTSVNQAIKVTSKIKRVVLVDYPKEKVNIKPNNDYDFVLTFRLLDKNDTGVAGKIARKVTAVTPDSRDAMVFRYRSDLPQAKPSSQDGLVSVFIKITELRTEPVFANFTVTFDDSAITTGKIRLGIAVGSSEKMCSNLQVTLYPNNKIMALRTNFDIRIQAVNISGVVTGGSTRMRVRFWTINKTNTVTNSPATYVQYTAESNSVDLDEYGFGIIRNVKFTTAPRYETRIMLQGYENITGTEAIVSGCVPSNKVSILFSNEVEEIKHCSEQSFSYTTVTYQDSDQAINMDASIKFNITVLGASRNPLSGIYQEVYIMPIQIPPSYYVLLNSSMDLKDQMSKFIQLSPSGDIANMKGEIIVSIKILKNYFGKWCFCFFIGNVCSRPIFLKTNFPVKSVILNSEPSAGGVTFPIGQKLPIQPIVTVYGENNIPLSNVVVTALIQRNANQTAEGVLDLFSTDISSYDSYETYVSTTPEGQRYKLTNDAGKAIFTSLGLIDVKCVECFAFIFAVGEPGMFVMSDASMPICFVNTYNFTIKNKISQMTRASQYMVNYPVLEIRRDFISQGNFLQTMLFASYLFTVDTIYAKENNEYARQFLSGNFCYYVNGKKRGRYCGEINVLNEGSIGVPYVAEIPFRDLTWTKPTVATEFRFSIGTMVKNFSRAISDSIGISSNPLAVTIEQEGPDKIAIGDLFRMSVKVTIAEGVPLEQALVYCNVTKGLSFNMPTVSGLSSTSDLINKYGNTITNAIKQVDNVTSLLRNLSNIGISNITELSQLQNLNLNLNDLPSTGNIKQTVQNVLSTVQNQIALLKLNKGALNVDTLANLIARNNVELERTQTSAYTDKNGIANFQLRFISARTDNYSIAFQSGSVVSKKSREIYVVNNISSVEYTANTSQEIPCVFNKDPLLNYMSTFVQFVNPIQVTLFDSNRQEYTEQVHSITARLVDKKSVDEATDTIKSNAANLSWADVQNIQVLATGTSDPISQLERMWKLMTTGADVMNLFKPSKDVNRYICKNVTRINGTLILDTFSMEVLQPGQYRLKIIVDGIETSFSDIITIADAEITPLKVAFQVIEYIAVYCLVIIMATINMPNSHILWVFVGLLTCGGGIYVYFDNSSRGMLRYIMIGAFAATGLILIHILIYLITPFCRQRTHVVLREKAFDNYTRKIFVKMRGSNDGPADESKNKEDAQKRAEWGCCKRLAYKICDVLRRLKRVFTPFEVYATKEDPGDAFYYPQRFLTPILISTVSVVYLTYTVYIFIGTIKDGLDGLKISFRKAIYSFLNSGIANAMTMYKYDVSNKDMSSIVTLITEVEKYFDQFVIAIYIAFIVSTSIAAFLYILSLLFVMLDFRKRTLELRRGIWYYSLPRDDIPVSDSVNFVGAFISNSVLGFFSILILYGILLTPLFYSLFWIVILLNIKTILIFVLPSIIQPVVLTISKKIFSTKHFITWRLVFSLIDNVFLYFGIITAATGSIVRIIMLLVIVTFCTSFNHSFLGLIRIDKPIFPMWILRWFYFDVNNYEYISTLVVFNNHNHPIVLSFVSFLEAHVEKEMIKYEEKKKKKAESKKEAKGMLSEAEKYSENLFCISIKSSKGPLAIDFTKGKADREKEEEKNLEIQHDENPHLKEIAVQIKENEGKQDLVIAVKSVLSNTNNSGDNFPNKQLNDENSQKMVKIHDEVNPNDIIIEEKSSDNVNKRKNQENENKKRRRKAKIKLLYMLQLLHNPRLVNRVSTEVCEKLIKTETRRIIVKLILMQISSDLETTNGFEVPTSGNVAADI